MGGAGPAQGTDAGAGRAKAPDATVPCWVLIGRGEYLACDG